MSVRVRAHAAETTWLEFEQWWHAAGRCLLPEGCRDAEHRQLAFSAFLAARDHDLYDLHLAWPTLDDRTKAAIAALARGGLDETQVAAEITQPTAHLREVLLAAVEAQAGRNSSGA